MTAPLLKMTCISRPISLMRPSTSTSWGCQVATMTCPTLTRARDPLLEPLAEQQRRRLGQRPDLLGRGAVDHGPVFGHHPVEQLQLAEVSLQVLELAAGDEGQLAPRVLQLAQGRHRGRRHLPMMGQRAVVVGGEQAKSHQWKLWVPGAELANQTSTEREAAHQILELPPLAVVGDRAGQARLVLRGRDLNVVQVDLGGLGQRLAQLLAGISPRGSVAGSPSTSCSGISLPSRPWIRNRWPALAPSGSAGAG